MGVIESGGQDCGPPSAGTASTSAWLVRTAGPPDVGRVRTAGGPPPAAASLGGERAGLTHRLAPPSRCGSGGPAVRAALTLNAQHSTVEPLRGIRLPRYHLHTAGGIDAYFAGRRRHFHLEGRTP